MKKLRVNVVRCRKKSDRHARKGYLVDALPKKVECQSENSGFCTLIEGETDKVKVKGALYTRDSYILQAFDLPENCVANYAKMVAKWLTTS